MRPKHGPLFFLSSCVPGCGQMHQGYMKRGGSILTAFCLLFALAVFLEIGAVAVLMLPLWLYSFFDSYNLRTRMLDGTAEPDAYLFGLSDMDSRKLAALCCKRHSIIGWALVAIGLYALYENLIGRVLSRVLWQISELDWLYYLLVYDLPRLAVTVLIIALGVWFIRGPRKSGPDDIPPFTPPAGEEDRHDQL